MQTVKTILEDLSRFSPEARVEPELEIDGISPATECAVATKTQREIESELEKSKEDVDGYRDELGHVRNSIKEIHANLCEAIEEKDWKRVGELNEDIFRLA